MHASSNRWSSRSIRDIKKYEINRDDSVPFVAFDFRPMFAITKVAPRFLPLSLDERIRKVLLEIVKQGQLTPNYAAAIVEIRHFMGNK